MDAPVIAYGGFNITVPPLAGGVAPVTVEIPDSMWDTWLIPNGNVDISGTQGPVHVPNQLVTWQGTTDDSNGAPFLNLSPHGLARPALHLNTGRLQDDQVTDGVLNVRPDLGPIFPVFPGPGERAYFASFPEFPTPYVTSQSISLSLSSNYVAGGPSVTLIGLAVAFVDNPFSISDDSGPVVVPPPTPAIATAAFGICAFGRGFATPIRQSDGAFGQIIG